VLSALAYLRLLVYFCLGFGPAGWGAMATGRGALGSLVIAAPAGLLAALLAQAFFRFQRHDTNSALTRADLLHQEATVLVPLDHEQYALAVEPDATFDKGQTVRIMRITEECVYVR
jgi:hypothetical protein